MNFLYLQKANNFDTMTAVVNKDKNAWLKTHLPGSTAPSSPRHSATRTLASESFLWQLDINYGKKQIFKKITNNWKATTFGHDDDHNKPIMYHEARKKQQERDVALTAIHCTHMLHKPMFSHWEITASSPSEQRLVCLLLDRGGEKEALASSLWSRRGPNFWTSLFFFSFNRQTGFSSTSIRLTINRWLRLSLLYQADG